MDWNVEFFEDADKKQPARAFLDSLEEAKRAALIAAIESVLTPLGPDVCNTEYGKALGKRLYEFRVRHDEQTIRRKVAGDGGSGGGPKRDDILLRVFFAAYGQRIVLLLGGYDKGRDPSTRRQEREIAKARKALRSFELSEERRKAGIRRRG